MIAPNRKLRWLIFAILLFFSFCIVSGIWIADGTLHPPRRRLTEEESAHFHQAVSDLKGELRDVSITVPDGSKLAGWLVKPSHPKGNAALLLHGLGDNRLGMTGYAEMLVARGFIVLLPDARAHGASGGTLATFGLLEREDIRSWTQFLAREAGTRCVYGLGESMGAAQMLQALGSGAEFCSVIAESPFSNFREIAYDRMGQPFHLGPWVGRTILRPIVEVAFLRARWKYGLDMERVAPEDTVASAHVPVLLVHGQMDGNIPVRHSRRIHQRDPKTVLWEVPGADHCGALAVAPNEFERWLVKWFPVSAPAGLAAGYLPSRKAARIDPIYTHD